MNMNTPYFRAALTMAAVWIAVFAYLSYSDYRTAYRSTEYAAYGIPNEDTYECNSTVLDATKPGIQFRQRTSEEQTDCYRTATQLHIRSIQSGNQFAFQQALNSFGWNGVLPALLLL